MTSDLSDLLDQLDLVDDLPEWQRRLMGKALDVDPDTGEFVLVQNLRLMPYRRRW